MTSVVECSSVKATVQPPVPAASQTPSTLHHDVTFSAEPTTPNAQYITWLHAWHQWVEAEQEREHCARAFLRRRALVMLMVLMTGSLVMFMILRARGVA